jgi:hypothetical protein
MIKRMLAISVMAAAIPGAFCSGKPANLRFEEFFKIPGAMNQGIIQFGIALIVI